jgi:hypothetical protein
MNIHESINKIMQEMSPISKDSTNTMQGYKFRGIDDVYNALQKLLARHGIFTVPSVLEFKTEERNTKSGGVNIYRVLTVEYTMYASDGSSIKGISLGEGFDAGDKSTSKAMSMAHKYFLFQTFMIPTEGQIDDSDKETAPPVQARPKPDMSKFINNVKIEFKANPTTLKEWCDKKIPVIAEKFGSAWERHCKFTVDQLCRDAFKIEPFYNITSNPTDANGEPV